MRVSRAMRRGRPMAVARQRSVTVVLLLAVVAALGWAVARSDVPMHRALSAPRLWAVGPVYTVAEVERRMALAPSRWLGRTVLVQGRVAFDRTWSPPDSIVTRLALVDPGRSDSTMSLSLRWGSPDPLLASLRRLPFAGRLVPAPQRPRWGTLAVYRIQLDGLSGRSPDRMEVVLLDADPGYRWLPWAPQLLPPAPATATGTGTILDLSRL